MDTSKKYVEMCKKAVEIQGRDFEAWDIVWAKIPHSTNIPQLGMFEDYDFKPGKDLCTITFTAGDLPHGCVKKETLVWLPRQDQLQEMIIKQQGWQLHQRDIKTLLHNVCLSIEKGLPPFNKLGFYSMEQLWLAFVMAQKYNKVWNGKEWIIDQRP